MQDIDLHDAMTSGVGVHFETAADLRRLALAMVERSGRTLDLIGGEADFQAYDTVEFVEAVKKLVVSNPHSRVRILLLNSMSVVGEGHRLIELVLRLTSYIEVRGLAPEFRGDAEALLVADQRHGLQLSRTGRFQGEAWFDAPRRARAMTERFEELWLCGEPDPNFRRLFL